MAKYINLNSLPPLNGDSSTSIFSRAMSAGSKLNSKTLLLIGGIVFFICVAVFYYFYFILPNLEAKYEPNSEPVKTKKSNKCELLFFYADWCPHCKAAKPLWNEIKDEYKNKTINGYTVIFTEVDCSEETTELEKLMNQYNVEGFPTIKLIKDGQIIEYDAKPSKETLSQFLNTVL